MYLILAIRPFSYFLPFHHAFHPTLPKLHDSPIPGGTHPFGIAFNSIKELYMAKFEGDTASVIDPSTNSVVGIITVETVRDIAFNQVTAP